MKNEPVSCQRIQSMFDLSSSTPCLQRAKPSNLPQKPCLTRDLPAEIFHVHGESLTLSVAVDAYPAAIFTWYINNFEIRPSSNISLETLSTNESRATFLRPHAGLYKVVASNNYGTATSITRIRIMDTTTTMTDYGTSFASVLSRSPIRAKSNESDVTGAVRQCCPFFIKALPQQIYANGNKEIELEVKVAGENPISFLWFINGVAVECETNNYKPYNICDSLSINTSKLKVTNRADDAPINIAVEATNVYGSIWSETQMIMVIRVIDPILHGCLIDSTERNQYLLAKQSQSTTDPLPSAHKTYKTLNELTTNDLSDINMSHDFRTADTSILVQIQGN
jgi:hypothetical protein